MIERIERRGRVTDVWPSYPDQPEDALGRRQWVLTWADPDGVFRPEPSNEDGLPVGYRRGQVFFCTRAALEETNRMNNRNPNLKGGVLRFHEVAYTPKGR